MKHCQVCECVYAWCWHPIQGGLPGQAQDPPILDPQNADAFEMLPLSREYTSLK